MALYGSNACLSSSSAKSSKVKEEREDGLGVGSFAGSGELQFNAA
ncbi:MAG: hypothetical protein AABY26_06270 [Nanoarchaeota archaeon]